PPRQTARAAGELLEPAQALRPGHCGVRGRRGREHEELRLAEPPLLHPELGPLAERAAVRLLADEADPPGLELACELLEPLRRPCEVAAAQVARARRRAVRGVRDADSLAEELELLGRVVEAGREARRVEQAPEVVARVREVCARRRRDASRVDAAE